MIDNYWFPVVAGGQTTEFVHHSKNVWWVDCDSIDMIRQLSEWIAKEESCVLATRVGSSLVPILAAFHEIYIKPILILECISDAIHKPITLIESEHLLDIEDRLNSQFIDTLDAEESGRKSHLCPEWIEGSLVSRKIVFISTDPRVMMSMNLAVGVTTNFVVTISYSFEKQERDNQATTIASSHSRLLRSSEQLKGYLELFFLESNSFGSENGSMNVSYSIDVMSAMIRHSVSCAHEYASCLSQTTLFQGACHASDDLVIRSFVAAGFGYREQPDDVTGDSNLSLPSGEIDLISVRSVAWTTHGTDFPVLPTNIVLMMGQSNMAGRGDREDIFVEEVITTDELPRRPDDDVSSLNNTDVKQLTQTVHNLMCISSRNISVNTDLTTDEVFESVSMPQSITSIAYESLISRTLGETLADDVVGYDLEFGWSRSICKLHRCVDICKVVGFGSGPAFGTTYSALINAEAATKAESITPKVIGLVPMAVGATGITEWQHDYRQRVQDSQSILIPCRNDMGRDITSFIKFSPPCCLQVDSMPSRQILGTASGMSYSLPGYLCVPPNARYHPGSINLFSSAQRTLASSLLAFRGRFTGRNSVVCLDGLLWYQGENDTGEASLAESYHTRLVRFFKWFGFTAGRVISMANEWLTNPIEESDLPEVAAIESNQQGSSDESYRSDLALNSRNLTHVRIEASQVPVVSVGIVTTRPWLAKPPGQLNKIRQELMTLQLESIDKGSTDKWGILSREKIGIVDAGDLPLKQDNIHLSSIGYVELGVRLAHELKGLTSIVKCKMSSFSMSPEIVNDCYHCLSTQPFFKLIKKYQQIRKDCQPTLDQSDDTSLLASVKRIRGMEVSALPSQQGLRTSALRSGLKPANFVYGEVNPVDLLSLCYLAVHMPSKYGVTGKGTRIKRATEQPVFVSLGCGSGPCIAAALISGLFKQFIGIELLHAKFVECAFVTSQWLHHQFSALSELDEGASQMHQELGNIRVSVIESNFLAIDWHDQADVVYSCATCYAPDQLQALVRASNRLRVGARVILIDSLALIDQQYYVGSSESGNIGFELLGSKYCEASWGQCCAYVFEKI